MGYSEEMPPRLPDPRVGDPDRDDWLGEQGEVDWSDDPRAGRSAPGTSGDLGATASPRAGDVPTGQPDAPLSSSEARRRALVQRRRAIGLVALLALALVGVGVGLTVFRDDEPEQTSPTTLPATVSPPPPTTPPATTTATPPPAATTPPLTVELPAAGRLAFGDRGDEVETLQAALAALQLEAGAADGIFGESTREAVIAFQEANELTADGIVGAETVRRLNAELAEQGVTG